MRGRVEDRPRQSEDSSRGAGQRARVATGGVLCGLAGFLLGAAFWIFLGVLSVAGGALQQLTPVWDLHGGQGSGCTSLALDRHEGHTTSEPCRSRDAAPPLREALAALHGKAQ